MTFAYDEQLLSAVEQAMTDNGVHMNSVIPCSKGRNCNWPACPQDCKERPGRDPSTDPEVSADIACMRALDALDDLMVLANQDDTFPAVMANKVFAGQILTRAQMLVSFLLARETPKFKVISRA